LFGRRRRRFELEGVIAIRAATATIEPGAPPGRAATGASADRRILAAHLQTRAALLAEVFGGDGPGAATRTATI